MKFVGMFVDKNLSWNEQVKNVINKVGKSTYIMNATKRLLPINLKLTLYYSMIYCYLNYGSVLWGHTFQYNKTKLLKLQKKAVRSIKNTSYCEHTDPLFQDLQILKFEDIVKSETLKLMYKLVNDDLPTEISNKFQLNRDIHNYNTRHNNDVHIAPTKTSKAFKSILHQGPELWSNLNNDIKVSTSLQSFKSNLKKYLVNY